MIEEKFLSVWGVFLLSYLLRGRKGRSLERSVNGGELAVDQEERGDGGKAEGMNPLLKVT